MPYVGHINVGPNYIGHICVVRNYTFHSYVGHNYIGRAHPRAGAPPTSVRAGTCKNSHGLPSETCARILFFVFGQVAISAHLALVVTFMSSLAYLEPSLKSLNKK